MPKVLGIDICGLDIPTVVSDFLSDIKNSPLKANRLVSATGVHGVVTAQRSPEFKKVPCSFYCNLPDGMPLVWIGKLQGYNNMKRCPGPHFFEHFIRQSANEPVRHFFCGGKEGVANDLKAAVSIKFNNYNVVGTFCPPFRSMCEREILELGKMINATNADIIWIGLSTPKQEIFAQRLRAYTSANYIITVGAAFDFHTDRLRTAPNWMQVSGFEWLFRLIMEPKRLYKRYLSIIPLFIYYNIRALILGQDSFRDD